MKKLSSLAIIYFVAKTICMAVIAPNTVWEYRATNGNVNNGGGFVWINLSSTTYRWDKSTSGTNEYYCVLAAGGDPTFEYSSCSISGAFTSDTEGVMGSLNAGEWDYGDNDVAIAFNTFYVRLANGRDPDDTNQFTVCIGTTGGADYSQRNTPFKAIVDGSCAGAGNTITTAAGGLAASMKGNILNIVSGTNFTAGRYEIYTVADANTMTVDRACSIGVGIADAVINIGGAEALLTDTKMELWVAGNWAYIKNENMTLTGAIAMALAGTKNYPINITGYNTARNDNPTLDNRPLIIGGSNQFTMGNYFNFQNLRFNGTAAGVFLSGFYDIVYNCFFLNNSSAINRDAFDTNQSIIKNCEFVSLQGDGIKCQTQNASKVMDCFIHDSINGITCGAVD